MSIEKVRDYFRPLGREGDILEFPVSSATVELAAQAVGVIPARIAKTLSFLVEDGCVLIVAAGDAKIDNGKYKALFHTKAKMLTQEQVSAFTGHAVGGVCPFALLPQVKVYLRGSGPIWMFPSSGSTLSSLPPGAAIPPSSSPVRSWRDIPIPWDGSMCARGGRRRGEALI